MTLGLVTEESLTDRIKPLSIPSPLGNMELLKQTLYGRGRDTVPLLNSPTLNNIFGVCKIYVFVRRQKDHLM